MDVIKQIFFHYGCFFVGGECDSNGFVSEDELMDLASLYIPTFNYIENDIILFTQLQITQTCLPCKMGICCRSARGSGVPCPSNV